METVMKAGNAIGDGLTQDPATSAMRTTTCPGLIALQQPTGSIGKTKQIRKFITGGRAGARPFRYDTTQQQTTRKTQ